MYLSLEACTVLVICCFIHGKYDFNKTILSRRRVTYKKKKKTEGKKQILRGINSNIRLDES